MTGDLHLLTIAQASKLIEARKLSPVELTEALLSRIDSLDSQVNAFITVTADLALKQARRAEAEISTGRYRGPLHGIPFGLKDIYNTAGILTSAHSKICLDNIPGENATVTTKLFDAGAILLGKLATHEFAHGGPSFDLPWPPARNPWNLEHFTGGSSSGPAAAVAAGFVLTALGTDTGSSIRGPASLCGVVGLKPTFGLVSRFGVMPNAFSLDHCGPLTRVVEDCAIVLTAIAGHDPKDPSSAIAPMPDYRLELDEDIRGLRIGVVRHFWEEDAPADPEMCAAMDAALEVLRQLGAKLEALRMRPLQEYRDVKMIIGETELFAIHHRDLAERPGDFGSDFLGRTTAACLFQSVDYVQATRERRQLINAMASIYERYDAMVTACLGPAPRLAPHRTIEFWRKPNITTPFNVTGAPTLAICAGFTPSGLPLGMQIVGRPFDEKTVLKIGHAYQEATRWHTRHPRLLGGRKSVPVICATHAPSLADLDATTRQLVEAMVKQAGLRLSDSQYAQLFEAAPYALAIRNRIRHGYERSIEPASVFFVSDTRSPRCAAKAVSESVESAADLPLR